MDLLARAEALRYLSRNSIHSRNPASTSAVFLESTEEAARCFFKPLLADWKSLGQCSGQTQRRKFALQLKARALQTLPQAHSYSHSNLNRVWFGMACPSKENCVRTIDALLVTVRPNGPEIKFSGPLTLWSARNVEWT